MAVAHINRIGVAVPDHDVHDTFVAFVDGMLPDGRSRALFRRMVGRSGIAHRYSTFRPGDPSGHAADGDGFFARGAFPTTGARMVRFEADALALAERAVTALDLLGEREAITHLIVASCTGFTAPGLDQQLAARLGLAPSIERTLVGFMGCAAAVNALKLARHVIRSEPSARVLVVNLELCTVHFQETPDLERILSALLFGDGCAASLVTADQAGIALDDFRATTIPDTAGLITWRIGDQGFDMHLSGDVPGRIAAALRLEASRNDPDGLLRGRRVEDFDLFAVHAGGRTVLDAVEAGFGLDGDALRWSRGVLHEFGNMSSATLMFVLERILRAGTTASQGLGMAFGPGLAAETFRFRIA
jgi:predicted naringenin-chalcone synthase